MIRLGGVVGYAFEGPFPLTTWRVPDQGVIYAVVLAGAGAQFATEPEPGTVLHIDHSDNLAGDGFPWESKFAGCWVQFAGSREALAVAAFLRCPTRSMREQMTPEAEDVNPSWVGPGGPASAGPS